MENLYKGLFAQYDEDVSAANPYGCNQYGHRSGHQGGTGKAGKEGETDTKKEKDETSQLDEATRKKYDENWKKAVQEQLENERKFKEMVQKSIDKDPARKAFIEQAKTMGELTGQHVVARWSNKLKRDSFAKVEDDFYNFVKRGADREKLRDVPEDKLKYILRDEFVKSDENVVEKNGKPTIQSGDPFNNPLHGEAAMQAWWRKNGDKVLKRL